MTKYLPNAYNPDTVPCSTSLAVNSLSLPSPGMLKPLDHKHPTHLANGADGTLSRSDQNYKLSIRSVVNFCLCECPFPRSGWCTNPGRILLGNRVKFVPLNAKAIPKRELFCTGCSQFVDWAVRVSEAVDRFYCAQ